MPLKGTRRSRENIARKRKGTLFMTQAEVKRVNKEKKLAAEARLALEKKQAAEKKRKELAKKRVALMKKAKKKGVNLRTDYTALYRK